MKLNNQHREAFVNSILKAIPLKHPQDRAKTIAALEALIWDLVPESHMPYRPAAYGAISATT